MVRSKLLEQRPSPPYKARSPGVGSASAKIPRLLERGSWNLAHEARTAFSMLLSWIFLLVAGAGPRSLDGRIAARSWSS